MKTLKNVFKYLKLALFIVFKKILLHLSFRTNLNSFQEYLPHQNFCHDPYMPDYPWERR